MKKRKLATQRRKCAFPYCRKKARPGGKLCHAHNRQRWREKNPIKYSFENLKTNAKRRKRIFELTFEQFKEFAEKYDYMQKKGKTKESFSIDCIEPEKGYVAGNIQALSLQANGIKQNRQLVYDWQTRTAYVIKINGEKQTIFHIDDLPF